MRVYGTAMTDSSSTEEQSSKYKFSWMELVTNHKTGETSATGFCGILLIVIPLFLYCVLIAWYFFNMTHFKEVYDILDKLYPLVVIGASLLGLRKASSVFGKNKITIGQYQTKGDDEENNG